MLVFAIMHSLFELSPGVMFGNEDQVQGGWPGLAPGKERRFCGPRIAIFVDKRTWPKRDYGLRTGHGEDAEFAFYHTPPCPDSPFSRCVRSRYQP